VFQMVHGGVPGNLYCSAGPLSDAIYLLSRPEGLVNGSFPTPSP
jgi:hypothetical protein